MHQNIQCTFGEHIGEAQRQLVPRNQFADGVHLQRLQHLSCAKRTAPLARSNMLEKALQCFALLHVLRIGQNIAGEGKCLVKAALAAVAHVHHTNDGLVDARIEQAGCAQLRLQIGTAGQNDTTDIHLASTNKVRPPANKNKVAAVPKQQSERENVDIPFLSR